MRFDAYFNPFTQIVALVEPGDKGPTGYFLLSELIHEKLEDLVGSHGYHVLFQHVKQDLLIQAGISGLVYYQITDKDSFPKYKSTEFEELLDFYSLLDSQTFSLDTFIPFESKLQEANELYDWDFVQKEDIQTIKQELKDLYEALVNRRNEPCPYTIQGNFDTVVDNEEYTLLKSTGSSIAMLSRDFNLIQDLNNNSQLYANRDDVRVGSGIFSTGSKILAFELSINTLPQDSSFLFELVGNYNDLEDALRISLEDVLGTISLSVRKDTEDTATVIGGSASITDSLPIRLGIYYDQVNQVAGVVSPYGHFSTPMDPRTIDMYSVSITFTGGGIGEGKAYLYKKADEFQLLYPAGAEDTCGHYTPLSFTDKSRLLTAITDASLKDSFSITSASYSNLQDKIQEGQEVYDNYWATQLEIEIATANIYRAVIDLEVEHDSWEPDPLPPINKSLLIAAINSVTPLVQASYTTCSWDKVQAELSEATTVNNDINATQHAIDKATRRLNEAVASLEALRDRTAVIAFIEALEEIDPLSYTPDSWNALNSVVATARTLIANPCITCFDDIYDDLNAACCALVYRGIFWDHGIPFENGMGFDEEDPNTLPCTCTP